MANPASHPNPIEQAIAPWLHLLNQLYPPTGALLIGAGGGTGPWVQALQTLGIASTTLVEADDAQFENLQRNMQNHSGWRLVNRLVAAQAEPLAFYRASHNAESGLIEPESLRSLWPNLRTTHKETRQAITLAELHQESATPAHWLLVDCLPGLPIIQGAEQHLAGVDVIVVRVLLTQNTHDAPDAHGPRTATADQMHPALQALGFRCLAIETSRHPSIGHALFVRDTAALIQQQQQQLAQQTKAHAQALVQAKEAVAESQAAAAKHAEELTAQVQRLTQATAAAEKLAAERQERIDALQAESERATDQAKAAVQFIEQTKAAAAEVGAAAAKHTEKHAAQVQELSQAKAAADKIAAERQQRIDALQAENDLATERAKAAAKEAEQAKAAAAEANAAATAATATAAQQAEEHAAHVQRLTQAKAAAEKLAADCQQQLDQHKQALAQAKVDNDTLAAHKREELLKLTEQLKLVSSTSQLTAERLAALTQQQDLFAPALSATTQLSKQWQAFAETMTTRMATTESALAQMRHMLAAETLPDLLLPKLSEKLLEQSNSQINQLKEVESRLQREFGKGIGNAVKQIEAFVSIQNYLTTGESISGFHGWPISPDIGLFLLDRMREKHYDLIIEFGSGTSTALFARAAEVLEQQAEHKAKCEPTRGAVPVTTIVSFEHNLLYHSKTLQMLKTSGIDQHVRLVHAPLVDWRDAEETYIYYDCQSSLDALAEQHAHRQLRILVLVDGPPGNTCPNARFPVVPIVMNALGKHYIDLVLDDSDRQEEKNIIGKWQTYWKKRAYHVEEEFIASEKGIYIASINKQNR